MQGTVDGLFLITTDCTKPYASKQQEKTQVSNKLELLTRDTAPYSLSPALPSISDIV
jgi:hypothetical protein